MISLLRDKGLSDNGLNLNYKKIKYFKINSKYPYPMIAPQTIKSKMMSNFCAKP